jgi:hypothetical protein
MKDSSARMIHLRKSEKPEARSQEPVSRPDFRLAVLKENSEQVNRPIAKIRHLAYPLVALAAGSAIFYFRACSVPDGVASASA